MGTSTRSAALWTLAFLALGLGWRATRYLLAFPIWQDEAYLGISILNRDYAALFREPLAYLQIAPLGFLWLQRFVVEHLGGAEYAVRLLPFIAGCATLLIFAGLARNCLTPRAAAIAVAIFAVSYVLVRHTVEAKQYATDALLATLLLFCAQRWLARPTAWPPAIAAASIAGLGVWFSYPLIFVAAGVSLVIVVEIARSRRLTGGMPWAIFSAAAALSFLAFYLTFAARQSAAAADSWLEAYWNESFPPRDSVTGIAWWLLDVHTGKMLAYPLGGGNFASSATLLLCVLGGVALYRGSRRGLLALLLAPLVPALLAAALHKYPYGGSARVTIYLAPMICLLGGAGVDWLLGQLRTDAARVRAAGAVAVLLLAIGLGGVVLDLREPYKQPQYAAARDAMRDVATYVASSDTAAIANAEHDRSRPPDSPEFHPTLRYYLELYSGSRPHFCAAQPPPAGTRWMLTFYGADFGPQPARLDELLAPLGLQAVLHRDYRLSPVVDWRLGVFRCVARGG